MKKKPTIEELEAQGWKIAKSDKDRIAETKRKKETTQALKDVATGVSKLVDKKVPDAPDGKNIENAIKANTKALNDQTKAIKELTKATNASITDWRVQVVERDKRGYQKTIELKRT